MDKKLNVTNQNVKLALSKAKELLRNTNTIKNKNELGKYKNLLYGNLEKNNLLLVKI